MAWGASLGPSAARVIEDLLARYPHPEQGYRASLGLLSLSRRFTWPRVEAACARALRAGTAGCRSVQSILVTGLDQLPPEPPLSPFSESPYAD